MAKKYLNFAGLEIYDEQIKAYIDGEVDSIPSDVMIITVTKVDSKYSTDKTYDEIKQAYDDGKALYVKYNDGYDTLYELKTYDERNSYMTGFTFMNTKISNAGCTTKSIMIMSTGNVIVGNAEFTQEKIATVNTNSALTTTDKTLVGAINEVNTQISSHNHDDLYYTQAQIDGMKFITTDDIDEICGGVTEEGLPSNDIDELMAQLEEV